MQLTHENVQTHEYGTFLQELNLTMMTYQSQPENK